MMNDEFTTDMTLKEAVIVYAREAENEKINPKNKLVSAQMPYAMGAAYDALCNAEIMEERNKHNG